jgi:hypothetical protein
MSLNQHNRKMIWFNEIIGEQLAALYFLPSFLRRILDGPRALTGVG